MSTFTIVLGLGAVAAVYWYVYSNGGAMNVTADLWDKFWNGLSGDAS